MRFFRTRASQALIAAGLLSALFLSGLQQTARADDFARNRQVIQAVFDRVAAHVERPDGYDVWPPKLVIKEDPQPQAYASPDVDALQESGGKRRIPMITVTTGLAELFEFDEHRLAFVIGHEFGHHVNGDVLEAINRLIGELDTLPKFLKLTYDREEEFDADQYGMTVAVRAGYSYRRAMTAFMVMREKSEYTTFHELDSDHPNFANRLAALETDEAKRKFWRSMSAFENGVFFLLTEQYANAERCFEQVVREFPGSGEAWANLGNARLMMYCDGLGVDRLKHLELGHLVVGGFYLRPGGGLRDDGADPELWFDAVGAMKEALRLNPDLILAKANLAIAYLVRPYGKDVGQATRLFDEIAEALKDERIAGQIHPFMRAALMINAGVAQMGAGRVKEAQAIFDEAAEFIARHRRDDSNGPGPLEQALAFNKAFALTVSGNANTTEALTLLEAYLASTSPAVAWWQVAFERYVALAANQPAFQPKSRDDLLSMARISWRPITSVQVGNGGHITLTGPVAEAEKVLGEAASITPVAPTTTFKVLHFPGHGLKLMATRRIIAIVLDDPNGPALELRTSGLGSQPFMLRVGMTKAEFERIAGDGMPFGYLAGTDDNDRYRFYHDIGVAVKFRNGVVVELVVTRLPREESSSV